MTRNKILISVLTTIIIIVVMKNNIHQSANAEIDVEKACEFWEKNSKKIVGEYKKIEKFDMATYQFWGSKYPYVELTSQCMIGHKEDRIYHTLRPDTQCIHYRNQVNTRDSIIFISYVYEDNIFSFVPYYSIEDIIEFNLILKNNKENKKIKHDREKYEIIFINDSVYVYK